MRGWLVTAALLVPFLVAMAPASAEDYLDDNRLDIGLERVVQTQVLRYTGNESQSIRTHIDADHGNQDGVVSSAEVAAFQAEHVLSFHERDGSCYQNFTLVRIDGSPPTHTSDRRQTVTGAEGSNTSRAEIRIRHVTIYEFPKHPASTGRVTVEPQGKDIAQMDHDCIGQTESRNYSIGEGFDHWSWEFSIFRDNFEGFREVVPISHHVEPAAGHWFARSSASPRSVDDDWDGHGWSETGTTSDLGWTTFTFDVARGSAPQTLAGTVQSPPWLVVGGAAGSLALLTLVWVNEGSRIFLLRLLFALGSFTRLDQDAVLANRRRDEILQRIRARPGLSFSELRRESEIPNGALVHHLRILGRNDHFRSVKDGIRIRYYPRLPGAVFLVPRSRRQEALVETVRQRPGVTQNELAAHLGSSRLAVHRLAKRLLAAGDLKVERAGRHRRYFPGIPAVVQAGRPSVPLIRKT